jgi:hypothetical protein
MADEDAQRVAGGDVVGHDRVRMRRVAHIEARLVVADRHVILEPRPAGAGARDPVAAVFDRRHAGHRQPVRAIAEHAVAAEAGDEQIRHRVPEHPFEDLPVFGSTLFPKMHTPVGPKTVLQRLRLAWRGGRSTTACQESPSPSRVIRSLRISASWRYTPGLIRTVSPGLARLTAAWMDWPGHTTRTGPVPQAGTADVAGTAAIAAAPLLAHSTIPSATAHATSTDLRMSCPRYANRRCPPKGVRTVHIR